VALLGPELDHYIQGKDQYECTPLHIAILQGEQQPPAPSVRLTPPVSPPHVLSWHGMVPYFQQSTVHSATGLTNSARLTKCNQLPRQRAQSASCQEDFCAPVPVLSCAAGHVDCARCLVEGGADVAAECDGCPSLILAVCTAALPGRQAAALALVQLLQQAGADPMQRWEGEWSLSTKH